MTPPFKGGTERSRKSCTHHDNLRNYCVGKLLSQSFHEKSFLFIHELGSVGSGGGGRGGGGFVILFTTVSVHRNYN